jgi:hypothetical protein
MKGGNEIWQSVKVREGRRGNDMPKQLSNIFPACPPDLAEKYGIDIYHMTHYEGFGVMLEQMDKRLKELRKFEERLLEFEKRLLEFEKKHWHCRGDE